MGIRRSGRVGWLRGGVVGVASLWLSQAVSTSGTNDPAVRPAPDPVAERVELGRRLFHDPAASRTGTRSCADCHDPEHGYADEAAISRDARGVTLHRTQTLVDCADSPRMDWLGAVSSIEEVVRARTLTQTTSTPVYYQERAASGDPTVQFVSPLVSNEALPLPDEVLRKAGRYDSAFQAAFGDPTPTSGRVITAISAYCRSIRSGESAWDRFSAGDNRALSPPARRGLELFRGKAGCTSCHTMESGKRATFTDFSAHSTGLLEPATVAVEESDDTHLLRRFGVGQPTGQADDGPERMRFPTQHLPERIRFLPRRPPPPPQVERFKTPTLRDVAMRGPYMHNGSLRTLKEVVRFFLSGPRDIAGRDELMPTYAATDSEIDDIVAFLESLSSATRPGAPRVTWAHRASRTALRFVDADSRPLIHWPVVLLPAGDAMPGPRPEPEPIRLVTDGDGCVRYAPPPTTHVRIVLDGGLMPDGGCWIPDTCTTAQISLPIRGTTAIIVTAGSDVTLPDTLEVLHVGAHFFPDARESRTVLRRESVRDVDDGRVARYVGPLRTDVRSVSLLMVPPGLTCNGADAVRLELDPETATSVRFER